MAASPWPMPEVSTTMRSKPAAWHASSTSGNAWLISLPKSRVASERMKTRAPRLAAARSSPPPGGADCPWGGPAGNPARGCQGEIAFMRMRSPSSAPPLLRRLGSILTTAMRKASSWSSRRRRMSSSVRLLLPAPPVPVMPSTGILLAPAASASAPLKSAAALPFSSAVMACASARHAAPVWPCKDDTACGA